MSACTPATSDREESERVLLSKCLVSATYWNRLAGYNCSTQSASHVQINGILTTYPKNHNLFHPEIRDKRGEKLACTHSLSSVILTVVKWLREWSLPTDELDRIKETGRSILHEVHWHLLLSGVWLQQRQMLTMPPPSSCENWLMDRKQSHLQRDMVVGEQWIKKMCTGIVLVLYVRVYKLRYFRFARRAVMLSRLGKHIGAVASTVSSQREGPGFESHSDFFCVEFHVFPVPVQVVSGYSE